ncbi:unnamed protein product [Adineta ricciae]|uniref:Uncharacterized protein n=1 Tax=Adineta ricciae TaxID=249248 RepID=A0A815AYJ7_ADIRI|nr:unnamed protein product [Adineta ricciae]CAF1262965.1 unnamed protein product [Adineta ricciae]
MITANDINTIEDLRDKYSFSPRIFSPIFPNEQVSSNQQSSRSPSAKIRSTQQRSPTSRTDQSNLNTFTRPKSTLLPYTWLRKYERVDPIVPAPDLIYRYAYLEEPKRKKTAPMSRSFSSPTWSTQQTIRRSTTTLSPSPSSPRQSPSIYNYILQSFRENERQRNSKEECFSACIKRPLNDDVVLQRALSPKRCSTPRQKLLSSKEDFRNTQTMDAYVTQSTDQTYNDLQSSDCTYWQFPE